jgi:hypothetical protein
MSSSPSSTISNFRQEPLCVCLKLFGLQFLKMYTESVRLDPCFPAKTTFELVN